MKYSAMQRIKKYFLVGETLTVQKTISKFHTTELRCVVSRLRKEGIPILSELCLDLNTDKWYKEYWVNKTYLTNLSEK